MTALRNGLSWAAKRLVLELKTARFRSRNGRFCNTLEARYLTEMGVVGAFNLKVLKAEYGKTAALRMGHLLTFI